MIVAGKYRTILYSEMPALTRAEGCVHVPVTFIIILSQATNVIIAVEAYTLAAARAAFSTIQSWVTSQATRGEL